MKRLYRVRENARFQEIRRRGKSYSDRYLVLCILPNDLPYSRFGFSVSSRIGNAVERNRIKRRLGEAMRLRQSAVEPGWDLVFIARKPICEANFHEMDAACARLVRRARLLNSGALVDSEGKPAHGDEYSSHRSREALETDK